MKILPKIIVITVVRFLGVFLPNVKSVGVRLRKYLRLSQYDKGLSLYYVLEQFVRTVKKISMSR